MDQVGIFVLEKIFGGVERVRGLRAGGAGGDVEILIIPSKGDEGGEEEGEGGEDGGMKIILVHGLESGGWGGTSVGVGGRAEAEGGADDGFEGLGLIEEGDFDAEKENGNIAGGEGGETDGVFFGGDEGEATAGAGTGEGVFDLGSHEAVVIGKGALVDDFGSEANESLHETFGDGDAGNGADAKAAEVGEGEAFAGEKIFEVEGVMAARVNGGVAVVTADFVFDLGMIVAGAFGQEDEVGPAKGIGGFAEDAAGEDVLVAEGVLAVDEEEVEAVAEAEVLEAVVEEEGIGLVVANGVAGGFDAVGIDENGDAGEVTGEHKGFVAGLGGVEQDGLSIRDDARRGGSAAGEELIGQTGEEGFGDGFVATAENGDATTGFDKGAGKFFDDGGFTGAADGEVTHADDHDADGVAAEDGVLVEAGAKAHDAGVDGGEKKKKGLEKGGSATGGAIQDDIGRKLFERFESL